MRTGIEQMKFPSGRVSTTLFVVNKVDDITYVFEGEDGYEDLLKLWVKRAYRHADVDQEEERKKQLFELADRIENATEEIDVIIAVSELRHVAGGEA